MTFSRELKEAIILVNKSPKPTVLRLGLTVELTHPFVFHATKEAIYLPAFSMSVKTREYYFCYFI